MSRTPVVTHVHGETSLRDISKRATEQQVEKGKKCGHDSSDNSTHEECEEEREGQENGSRTSGQDGSLCGKERRSRTARLCGHRHRRGL